MGIGVPCCGRRFPVWCFRVACVEAAQAFTAVGFTQDGSLCWRSPWDPWPL